MKSIKIREIVEIVLYYEKKKLDRLNKKIFDVCIKVAIIYLRGYQLFVIARCNISKIVLLHGPLIRTDDAGNDENSREN